MEPYYKDSTVSLFCGDMREVLPSLDICADAVCTDPPYGETSLAWDRWVDGWPALVAACTRSMWCFGSMRMFTSRWEEYAGWKFSQDVVWEKDVGTGFSTDRFRRVHENACHFYRGAWSDVYHHAIRRKHDGPPITFVVRRKPDARPSHLGSRNGSSSNWSETGTRLETSVLRAKNRRRKAIHPTEKPERVLAPLIEYSVPPGGLVLDPFAGSASTLLTARQLGRRAIGIEANEEYCEKAAERLSVPDLFGGVAS